MENYEGTLSWQAETVKEHLTLISVYKTLPNESDRQDFIKFLTKDVSYQNLTSSEFSQICYFLIGVINLEERNKLIRWPLITKQDQTKFRKGLKILIDDAVKKYPWADLKMLPESYFLQPTGKQKKVLDFILSLTGLSMHLLMDDANVLIKSSKEGLSLNGINHMVKIVQLASVYEEKIINQNTFPVEDFERVKNDVSNKCIVLKQENGQLEMELKNMYKELGREKIIENKEQMDVNYLQEFHDKKIKKLKHLNNELKMYHDSSVQVLSKLKTSSEPESLSIRDFNCDNSSELSKATSDACDTLNEMLEQCKLKQGTVEEEEKLLKNLKNTKNLLLEERDALHDFLDKVSQ